MEIKVFDKFLDEFFASCMGLLSKKGHEYAGPSDRFANFKRNARGGRSALDVWDIYQSKHEDGIRTFIDELLRVEKQNGTKEYDRARATIALFDRQSEPIIGRFHDRVNYLILGAGMLQEIYDEAISIRNTVENEAERVRRGQVAEAPPVASGSYVITDDKRGTVAVAAPATGYCDNPGNNRGAIS